MVARFDALTEPREKGERDRLFRPVILYFHEPTLETTANS